MRHDQTEHEVKIRGVVVQWMRMVGSDVTAPAGSTTDNRKNMLNGAVLVRL